jgi:hypothetical protein
MARRTVIPVLGRLRCAKSRRAQHAGESVSGELRKCLRFKGYEYSGTTIGGRREMDVVDPILGHYARASALRSPLASPCPETAKPCPDEGHSLNRLGWESYPGAVPSDLIEASLRPIAPRGRLPPA